MFCFFYMKYRVRYFFGTTILGGIVRMFLILFFCSHCTCSRFCRNLWQFLFVVTGLVFVSIATLLFVHFFFTPSSLPSELVSTLISFISDPHGTIVTFLTNKDCIFLFISFLSTGVWLVSFFMCKRLLASLFLYNICIFYDK